jgi:hypothetical protein
VSTGAAVLQSNVLYVATFKLLVPYVVLTSRMLLLLRTAARVDTAPAAIVSQAVVDDC